MTSCDYALPMLLSTLRRSQVPHEIAQKTQVARLQFAGQFSLWSAEALEHLHNARCGRDILASNVRDQYQTLHRRAVCSSTLRNCESSYIFRGPRFSIS